MWFYVLGRVRRLRHLAARDRRARRFGEIDAPADLGMARSRATGGEAQPSAPDTHSTTGTTPHGEFVGRASGDDPGTSDRGEHERR